MNKSSRSHLSGLAAIALVGWIALGALGIVSVTPPPGGTGAKWYAPWTWFSHKPADAVDKAKTADAAAGAKVDTASAQLVHLAAQEADKTRKAAAGLPPSPAAAATQRLAGNTFGLLNQVSPLTAAEDQNDSAIILGMLSNEITKREAAEAAQAAAEKANAVTSIQLQDLKAQHAETGKKLASVQDQLREAFEDRNAKANELAAGVVRRNLLIGLCVVLLGLALYFRSALGSFGAVLHQAEGSLTPDKYHELVARADTELGLLGQWAVRTGKLAAVTAQAKAKALLSGVSNAT